MEATANTLQLSTYLSLLAEVTGQPVDTDAGSAIHHTVPRLQQELKDVGNSLDARVKRVGRSYGALLVYQGLPTISPPNESVRSWLQREPNRTVRERVSHAFQDWLNKPSHSALGRVVRLVARLTTQLLGTATASREYAAWSASLGAQLEANQKRLFNFINQPADVLTQDLLRAGSGGMSRLAKIAGPIDSSPALVNGLLQSMRNGIEEALLPLSKALEAVRAGNNAGPSHAEALQLIERNGINTQDVPRLTVDGRRLPDSHAFTNGDSEVKHLVSRHSRLSRAITERIRNVQAVQAILDRHPFYGILMEGWSADSMESCLASLNENSARIQNSLAMAQASPVQKTG